MLRIRKLQFRDEIPYPRLPDRERAPASHSHAEEKPVVLCLGSKAVEELYESTSYGRQPGKLLFLIPE